MNRVTHLDYLADKLREDRVRRVIEPMLSGSDRHAFTDRDVGYARDLGLLARDAPLRVANPIYAEVLPRELAWVAQETLELSPPRYVKADGSLDAELLTPVFRGTRVPVRILFEFLAAGGSLDESLDAYPSVSRVQAITLIEAAEQTVTAGPRSP